MEGVAHAQSRSLSPWAWRAGQRTPGHWGGEPTNTRRHLDAFRAGELRLQPAGPCGCWRLDIVSFFLSGHGVASRMGRTPSSLWCGKGDSLTFKTGGGDHSSSGTPCNVPWGLSLLMFTF